MKFYYYLQAPNSIGFGKESERSMIMTKSKRDDIPSTQESLVKWALDNGYSPVTSYTVAPMANRFHLRLESNGKYDFFVIVYRILFNFVYSIQNEGRIRADKQVIFQLTDNWSLLFSV